MREITTIAIFLLMIGEAFSSPATNFRQFRNARLDSYAPSSSPDTDQESGPYPPSGWTPSGDLLLVPGETHSSQQNGYGPPPPPTSQYGPVDSTTESVTTTTTTTQRSINEEPDASEGSSQLRDPSKQGENGQYYVLLPNGKLQRVQYSGKKSGRGQFEAQVQYEEVEPVRAPVLAYQDFQHPLSFRF